MCKRRTTRPTFRVAGREHIILVLYCVADARRDGSGEEKNDNERERVSERYVVESHISFSAYG